MSKDIAIGKKIKISEAQQYMLLAALGAGVVFGVCLAFVIKSVSTIEFNSRILKEENAAIKAYSKTIENIGICKAPSGDVYTDEELKKCDPNSTDLSSVPGTLRANVLEQLASSTSLESVPAGGEDISCMNDETEKRYTYDELNQMYNDAEDEDDLSKAINMIKSCSALRVIPDALPAQKNEEALLASLNRIFNISGWDPESLSPANNESDYEGISGLNSISVALSVEAEMETTQKVLNNIERSIREFSIEKATIEWSDDELSLSAQARAFYVDKAELAEITKTVKVQPDAPKKGKR